MRILTSTPDAKISAINHLLEISIGEYSEIAKDILENNDLQRKRVKTANKSYSLLKEDIKVGCVIPPIVLAFFPNDNNELSFDAGNILEKIATAGNDLLILDGLQRTYTILDLLKEIKEKPDLLSKVLALPLRVEVYTGISKVGVLYRMLTLNTGQSPMSTRHQVEILYSDYKEGFDNLTFITEAQDKVPSGDNEFKFNDILDGFISYLTGDYLPLDREDLVKIIKNLETLTKDDKSKDLFKQLITAYNKLRLKINLLATNWQYEDIGDIKRRAYGKNVNELFSKVQTIAGFGAAVSFIIESGLSKDIESINNLIDLIESNNIEDSLNQIIKHIDEIQINAKKIGNEQRMYFYYFFRCMFNESNEGFKNLDVSVQQANKFYKANMLG
ncbi:hypothetical protein FFWV33_03925 [Flavobacterium faecale]|uniref:DUF262 domain-containing protein n=1 Tax=Flavobacterium faecale TaxID=1355330 RepID=A0A2S1LAN6_9FLAO|nr:hypothetical protein [Flavobacterium faecale]AWG20748.1 hypothetical protein FFWV33_03925 [Flavobacterium faecale]